MVTEMTIAPAILFTLILFLPLGIFIVVIIGIVNKYNKPHNRRVPDKRNTIQSRKKRKSNLYVVQSPAKKRIASNQNAIVKGQDGEKMIVKKLAQLPYPLKIINNVYLPLKNGGTTEVDIIVLSRYGIVVVESKNYSGWIFGSREHQYWTQSFPTGQKVQFYNPMKQNETHIRALRRITNFPDHYFQSVIIFGDESELKKVPRIDDIPVIHTRDIQRFFKSYIRTRNVQFSDQEVDELYRKLKGYTQVSKEVKQKHLQEIQRNKKK